MGLGEREDRTHACCSEAGAGSQPAAAGISFGHLGPFGASQARAGSDVEKRRGRSERGDVVLRLCPELRVRDALRAAFTPP